MILFDYSTRLDATLCAISQRFDPQEQMRAVSEAYRAGLLKPGRDRVIWIGPEIDISEIAVADMFATQHAISRTESVKGVRSVYRVCFVSADPELAKALDLWRGMWNASASPQQPPDVFCAATLEQAGHLLGATDLPGAFAPLLARARARPRPNRMGEGP